MKQRLLTAFIILCMLFASLPANAVFAGGAAPGSAEYFQSLPPVNIPKGTIDMDQLRPYTVYGDMINSKLDPVYCNDPPMKYMNAPDGFQTLKIPDNLPMVAKGMMHIGDLGKQGQIKAYFSPDTTGYARGHLLNELAQIGVYRSNQFLSTDESAEQNSNTAIWAYTGSPCEVVAYNDDWVAIWDTGWWDKQVGINAGGPCGSMYYSGFGHPGVYYIERKYVYLMPVENNLDTKSKNIAACGSATASLLIKASPDKEGYITSGVYKINDTFEILDTEPVNGHYKVLYNYGAYYVNAEYVNIKKTMIRKPAITYTATAGKDGADTVNIYSEAAPESTIAGKVKSGTQIEVIEKDHSDAFSKIWFNSRECYIDKDALKNFHAMATALGSPIGTIVVDTDWRAYGAHGYQSLIIPENGKSQPEGLGLKLKENETAPVYEMIHNTYVKTYPSGGQEEIEEVWYKTLKNGKTYWIPNANSFTYYPAGGKSYEVTASNQAIRVDSYLVEEYEVPAYNINDNNYFKIRDIAKILSGTFKTFDVEWNEQNSAINLVSMFYYTEAGGELTPGDGAQRTAVSSQAKLMLDGVPINAVCYNIDGNNYFKLRDVTDALDCRVNWDSETNKITITTYLPAKEDPNQANG